MDKIIYTVGHSTRSIEDFLKVLNSFAIQLIADVRSYPGSKIFSQFNSEELKKTLHANGIEYIHIKELGGRRKEIKESRNTIWKNKSFRSYADYMETKEFLKGIKVLSDYSIIKKTAFMCAEAVWWRCHRSMISDYLKANGWQVIHIMETGKSQAHPYTRQASIIDGKLVYGASTNTNLGLFDIE